MYNFNEHLQNVPDLTWNSFAFHSKVLSYLWKHPFDFDTKTGNPIYRQHKKKLIPWFWVTIVSMLIGTFGSTLGLIVGEIFSPQKSTIMNTIIFIMFNQFAFFGSAISYVFYKHGAEGAFGYIELARIVLQVRKGTSILILSYYIKR